MGAHNFQRWKRRSWFSRIVVVSLGCIWMGEGVRAQSGPPIVPAEGSPHAPSVVQQGAVPIININAPSPGGVSRNEYEAFNVPREGAVLNNTGASGHLTQVAGAVAGNPNYSGDQAASLILNEVTGTTWTSMLGALEVNGHAADVVVANPNGIFCGGCLFNNIPRVVLTTGKPFFDAEDRLSGVRVTRGELVVHDALGADSVARLDLWAKKIVVAGTVRIEQGELFAVAGNTIVRDRGRHDTPTVEPVGGEPVRPAGPHGSPDRTDEWGIDVMHLGGVFAGRIVLIASGDDIGVRNLGRLYVDEKPPKGPAGRSNDTPGRRIDIRTRGLFENAGRIESWHAVDIRSDGIFNRSTGVMDAVDVRLHGGRRVANEGHIHATFAVIAADEVTNYAGKVAPWQFRRERDAQWRAQYDALKSGHVDTRERLTVATQRLLNGPGAQMRSDADLRIHGNAGRWSSQYAPPAARVFSNHGVVLAQRSLDVSADAIQNWNESLKIVGGPRQRDRVVEYVDTHSQRSYAQRDVRHVTVNGVPMLETHDGQRISHYTRY
ncbi:protein of unknown function [Pararobbsia alpina]|uniref:filamentous hemagglutinin N-terminal domain-containing protein n=1 Tax=Pararobbsia alpina TaxID=621374 RepID=UPI0039A57C1B